MALTDDEADILVLAREGDSTAFDRLVAPYRAELHAHCYRLLASVHDAEDAVQDALLGAWRGLAGFEGRSSLRAWLYRIATNAAMKVGGKRPTRQLSLDYCASSDPSGPLAEPVLEPIWVGPYPDALLSRVNTDPARRYELRESVELAFVAALQQLPATQRAVLLLREVLAFPAAEVAELLDLSVPAVNSALQRARVTLERRRPAPNQQSELRALGPDGQGALVAAFADAWERADIAAITDLLVEDVRLSMPPLPVWFDGRPDVTTFMSQRMFATPWRLVPLSANGQLGFACYQRREEGQPFRLGAVNLLGLSGGRIADIVAFLDPADHALFGLPPELGTDEFSPPIDS